MFVRQSTYHSVVIRYSLLKLKYDTLLDRWNDLIERLNAKGGESFLAAKPNPFSPDEIKTLIKLCHPDKHAGAADAEEITRKLLTLR